MFPTAQISLLLQQMDFLISAFVENTDQSLKSLVSGLEQHAEILSIENPHPAVVPASSTRTLATVFEDTVFQHPNAIALEMTSEIRRGASTMEKLTYAELNASANKLARELVHRGTRPDEMVAVCMDKSIFCYVSILATVKAGAGYLPLTVETPIERAKTILKNAQVKILLSTRDFMDQLGSVDDVDIIDVKTLDLSLQKSDDLGLIVSSRTLAYAVFTSGSTGVPKGVLVEHHQAVGNLDTVADLYPTAVGKRMLQFCNIAFDVSVFEIFFTWHRGMILCSATKDVLLHDMEAAVNALKITHLSMTPTVAALISPQNVPRVEFLVTSGEAVTKKVFNDWAGRDGFYQGYGPSETTNICTANKNVEKAHDISNIGRPFENTSAFVVTADEEELILLPRGGVGELCFGGVQVVRGYLNMDGLTARKFVVHPKYGKIYRSGDIGRLLPSGDIIFIGRQDDQVKIRGNRIELGEVTSVLLRNPGIVVDAVTLVVTKDEQSQLVSYVVPASFQTSSFAVVQQIVRRGLIADLFEQATTFMPLYMVPGAIVPVTMIPMTHQGKTDKKALNAAFLNLDNTSLAMFSKGETSEEDSGNWTGIERFVAKSVAEVAHVHPNTVGRNTSIFKLGLDSISAIYLSRKLEGANEERLEVSQIMRNPTVAALAVMLAESTKLKVDSARQTGAARLKEFADFVLATVLEQLEYAEEDIVKILPCTPLQEAMLSMKGDSPRNYYNHTVLKLKANPERLKSAWESVAKVHDIMRTCFVVTSHRQHAYAQVVVREHALPWTHHEVDSAKFSGTVEEHISQVSNMIDTSRPPYAFGLFKSPEHTCLVMSFHHSLYDGLALDLLLEEVQRAYNNPNDLLPRPHFDIYLAYMEGIHHGAADKFWLQKFRGFQPTSFPELTGRSNATRKQLSGMTLKSLTCSKGLDAINAGCKSLSISLLALGQSSWARLLSAYTGEHDLCFGNVVSGRTIPVDGVEEIIAPCFNTLPVRITLNSGVSTRSVMEKLHDSNTEMMPYQLTPLRRIMAVLKTDGRTLFDTLFILQHAPENSFHELWEEVDDRGEMDVGFHAPPPPPE
jgi:amino acid adenylation domain-containing protein